MINKLWIWILMLSQGQVTQSLWYMSSPINIPDTFTPKPKYLENSKKVYYLPQATIPRWTEMSSSKLALIWRLLTVEEKMSLSHTKGLPVKKQLKESFIQCLPVSTNAYNYLDCHLSTTIGEMSLLLAILFLLSLCSVNINHTRSWHFKEVENKNIFGVPEKITNL